MKKIAILFLLGITLFMVTGCEEEGTVVSNGEKVNTTKMEHKHCERGGTLENGEVSLQYEIYYTGEVLNLIQSEEKVMSEDKEILDTYEEAYKGIHAHYEGLKYYDTEVKRDNNSVTSTIVINYDKIDISALLAIEG